MNEYAEQQPDYSSRGEMIGRAQLHPLIGREQEFSSLQQALFETEKRVQLRQAANRIPEPQSWVTPSRSPFYLLYGDMGIGKTRLTEEVGRVAHRRGWSLLWGRAYAQDRAPYQLWIDILRQAIKYDYCQELEKKISPSLASVLTALLPELIHLLPQKPLSSSPPPEQLWEAMLAALLLIAEHGPVLLVLDDLQWADTSSCDFLTYLCRQLVDLPFLLLGTYRNTRLPAEHTLNTNLMQLRRERLVESLQLTPLTDNQIAAFVNHLPRRTLQHIQYLAAGNPFFAEELVRAVEKKKEEGQQIAPDQRWTLPQTISELFEQRLNRLSKDCQSLLRAAAVLGVSFSFDIICLMLMKGGSIPADQESILVLLEEAQRAELLAEQGSGIQVTYYFWHPLLLHHLYETTSAARRLNLHRRAGQVLQNLYTHNEEEGAASIAYHLVQSGGDSKQIARYAELAGQRAYRLSAYFDAEKHYRQALEHLQLHLQKSLQITAEEQLHVICLQEYLSACLRVLNRPKEARQVYEQMVEFYNRYYHDEHEVSSQPQLQALLHFHIARTWYDQGNMERALQYCEQAEHILRAAAVKDGGAWAYTYLQQSYVYWRKGLYAQAIRIAQQACSLFEDLLHNQQASGEAIDTASPLKCMLVGDILGVAHAYSHLGTINNSAGNYTQALIYQRKALKIYEQQSQKRNIAIICNDMGDIYLRLTDFSQARAFFERGLQDAKYVGDVRLAAYIIGNSGILAVRCGQLSEAEDRFRRAIMDFEECNELIGRVLFSPYLALLLTEQGQMAEAQNLLRTALNITRQLHLVPYLGYILIVLSTMRLIQVRSALEPADIHECSLDEDNTRLLQKARRTLERALAFEVDAEIRLEGHLTLLEVCWLLDRHEMLYEQIVSLRDKSQQSGLTWLLPRIERLLGNIRAAQKKPEQAALHFEASLHYAHQYDLHWEYAQTLYYYGTCLRRYPADENHVRSNAFLQEACQVLANCQATHNLQKVEKLLELPAPLVTL